MGLHHITDDGMLYWHCHNPNCQYHNCQDPLHKQTGTLKGCVHHDHLEQDQKPKGEAQSVHISHEDVKWTPSGTMVELPICQSDGCTEQLSCKVVFTEEELHAPNFTLPEYEESQEQVIDKDREELRAAFKALGHELPQKVHIVKTRRIVGYHQHPMIARHQKLAELMKANGKLPPAQED